MAKARAFLVLGRISNLPTVWANCLCAWTLGGGGELNAILLLSLGLSLIYVGGMYLNDYCDVDFDREYRKERPIPAGVVGQLTVLAMALAMFAFGLLGLLAASLESGLYSLILLFLVVLYNLIHKKTTFGVPVMAGCRAAIYLVVGAATDVGLTVPMAFAGAMMFFYALGVTSLARGESKAGAISWVSWLGLGAPIAMGVYHGALMPGFNLVASGLVAIWIWRVFKKANVDGKLIVGKTIGPLLAGICLVDLAVIANVSELSWQVAVAFLGFFVAALVAQKSIPAS